MAAGSRPTIAGRLRRFGLRELRHLDSRGWLSESTSPIVLGSIIFVSVAFIAIGMYGAGQGQAVRMPLGLALIAAWGTATAAALALVTSRYHAARQLDEAQIELISLHGELELETQGNRALLHDARAVVGAMSAALHALERSGEQQKIHAAMTSQVDHLRELLSAPSTAVQPTGLDRFREPILSFANLHNLALAIDLPTRVHVLVEPVGVTTILLNLIDNARKYAPGAPIQVFWEPSGTDIHICVEDTGPGMPTEAEKLFLEGARMGDTSEGLGLGLATARRLAEKSHGSLWHERRAGPGSRFVLKLPRATGTSLGGTP